MIHVPDDAFVASPTTLLASLDEARATVASVVEALSSTDAVPARATAEALRHLDALRDHVARAAARDPAAREDAP